MDIADGHALVFEWTDAVSLGRQYDQTHLIRALPLSVRERIVDDLFDFGDHVVRQGWVAIDFYDGSIMVDLITGAAVVCDIDVFAPAPVINTMGRMWGSTRFMSAEEYELGAAIDEVSNVVTLGGLAFALLGDSDDKDVDTWESSPELFAVASRACQVERADRWSSVAELRAAWLTARAGRLHT